MKKITILAAALGVLTAFQTAQAAFSGSLGSLVDNNGTLTIGDKTYSGFTWLATGSDANIINTLNQQAANLQVQASIVNGVYYLSYAGLIGLDNLLGQSSAYGDLKLGYTVTASGGSIIGIDQAYTPNALPVPGNQIIIGETVKNGNVIVGTSTLSLSPQDLSDPATEAGDLISFDPARQLAVVKDIAIWAAAGQSVGLSYVEQSYHQTVVPEPSTVVAGALLLLPFGVSTLRILRKNKAS